MAEVTPKDLKNLLNIVIQSNVTPFIWGGPGIGKSSIVKSLAEENGYELVDIRLSMVDPFTLMGVIVPSIKDGTANWLPPSFFSPKKDKVLYFFDEINCAAPTIQAAAYQIIQDKRVGPHKLPENSVIIAAGNDFNDKGVTYRLPNPLANRFLHINLRADFDSFYEYAIKNKLHPHVVGYVNFQKGDLYNPNYVANNPSVKGFPTPRSWEFVSKILYTLERESVNFSSVLALVEGAVGEGVAHKFVSYKRVAEAINVDDILEGKEENMKNRELEYSYCLITGLCYGLNDRYQKLKDGKLKTEEFDRMCDNFMGFLLKNNVQPEFTIMAARTVFMMNIDVNIDDLPHWSRFFNDETYSRLIREAFSPDLNKKVS